MHTVFTKNKREKNVKKCQLSSSKNSNISFEHLNFKMISELSIDMSALLLSSVLTRSSAFKAHSELILYLKPMDKLKPHVYNSVLDMSSERVLLADLNKCASQPLDRQTRKRLARRQRHRNKLHRTIWDFALNILLMLTVYTISFSSRDER